jgi:y4mF family transcriptional regulator
MKYHTFDRGIAQFRLLTSTKYVLLYYLFGSLEDLPYFCEKSLLCQTMELMDIMKQRRETLSLTQQDLAEMSQVGLATIKDIERGKGNPALNTIKKILDVLGIEIEYRIRQTV